MRDNLDTDVNLMETRYRAKRGQDTLNVELGGITQTVFNSTSVNAATGGGGGTVSGSGVTNSITGGTSSGGVSCPEISQFILMRSDLNTPIPTVVKYVGVGMYLWSPVSRVFEKVIYAENFESELWEVSDGRVSGKGSPSHPLISFEDESGVPLKDCSEGLGVPSMYGTKEHCSVINHISKSGKGTVRKIETEGPTHTYCAGSSPDEMFWWHNGKRDPNDGGFLNQ